MNEPQNHSGPSSIALLHAMLKINSTLRPDASALGYGDEKFTWKELADLVDRVAAEFMKLGVTRRSRVAVLLSNRPESVVSAFATMSIGGIFVPVNPLLRPRQISHIMRDCEPSLLVTTGYFASILEDCIQVTGSLKSVVLVDELPGGSAYGRVNTSHWQNLVSEKSVSSSITHPLASDDPAIIFYTSGSTGLAKGVLLSHRNLLDGARIVSRYLASTEVDRILAALPISFDYGFSQVTIGTYVGAETILTNFSLPQQLRSEVIKHEITGLAGVPTMWRHIASLEWPDSVLQRLRYITNSGGHLPLIVQEELRNSFPETEMFLMYGLTEAFRSTILDAKLAQSRPDSIGMPLPGVNIHVINEDGNPCDIDEPGELVHSGALVATGYWNNPEATARKFRQLPALIHIDDSDRTAVWSGDIVRKDKDGLLYFLERSDFMIKSSGYRISPAEIEDAVLESRLVDSVVAIGIPDEKLGQRIGLAVVPLSAQFCEELAIRHLCALSLPPFMQPDEIRFLSELPLTANGKPDRHELYSLFANSPT